ncbi:MAG: 5-oxoproline transporter, DUF979 family subunit [Acidobacteriota bacterium]|jgi:uncharacterized membrane protein
MDHLTPLFARLFSLDSVYGLTGLVLLVFGGLSWRERRLGNGAFWIILGLIFLFGGVLPHWVTGLLVVAMVVLDGTGRVGRRGEPSAATATPRPTPAGARIFWPVLAIPLFTILVALLFRWLGMDGNRGALVGLGFGGVVAMLIAKLVTGGDLRTMMNEGRRLNESMGAVSILPQLLASLGVVFTAAQVGDLLAAGVRHLVSADQLFLLVLANCLGMALFTMVMGNSFAAFPVLASGVLVPLLIRPYGVDPALAAIITLTAGSSGTLLTPMAANFNIVPAALLNLRDQYGVIRYQLPYALALWSFHVLWLWWSIRSGRP